MVSEVDFEDQQKWTVSTCPLTNHHFRLIPLFSPRWLTTCNNDNNTTIQVCRRPSESRTYLFCRWQNAPKQNQQNEPMIDGLKVVFHLQLKTRLTGHPLLPFLYSIIFLSLHHSCIFNDIIHYQLQLKERN